MSVNSLSKTVTLTRQRRSCDLNLGPSAPESSTLTTPLPSHGGEGVKEYRSQKSKVSEFRRYGP